MRPVYITPLDPFRKTEQNHDAVPPRAGSRSPKPLNVKQQGWPLGNRTIGNCTAVRTCVTHTRSAQRCASTESESFMNKISCYSYGDAVLFQSANRRASRRRKILLQQCNSFFCLNHICCKMYAEADLYTRSVAQTHAPVSGLQRTHTVFCKQWRVQIPHISTEHTYFCGTVKNVPERTLTAQLLHKRTEITEAAGYVRHLVRQLCCCDLAELTT